MSDAVELVELLRLSRTLRQAREARAAHRGAVAPAPLPAAPPPSGHAWQAGDRVRIVPHGDGPDLNANKYAGRTGEIGRPASVIGSLPPILADRVFVLLDLGPEERMRRNVLIPKAALVPDISPPPAPASPEPASPRRQTVTIDGKVYRVEPQPQNDAIPYTLIGPRGGQITVIRNINTRRLVLMQGTRTLPVWATDEDGLFVLHDPRVEAANASLPVVVGESAGVPSSSPAPSSRPGDYRAAVLRIVGRPERGGYANFYRIEPPMRARLAKIAGFDVDEWGHDQFTSTPLLFGRQDELERTREAFARELPDADVTLHEYPTDAWAFGRTSAPEARDLPKVVMRTLARGASRTVAVKRSALGWQVARWGGAWRPFEERDAKPEENFEVEHGGRVRHLSDGTWVVYGSHLNAADLEGMTVHAALPSALAWAEYRHATQTARTRTIEIDAPSPVTPNGVMSSSVVGWKDGGPVVELHLVLPISHDREMPLVVRGHVPSGARRTKGDWWRKIEKVQLEVTRDSKPTDRFGYEGRRTLQRLVYETIVALPEAERARAQALRAPREAAPFQVGDHVRFVSDGLDRFGLVSGAIGVVDHIRRPRDAAGDLAEVVFGSHVELVAAGTKLFKRVAAGLAAEAMQPEALPADLSRAQLGALAARIRGTIAMLEQRIGHHEAMKEPDQAAETRRKLWRHERVLRLAEAALRDAPPEEPKPTPAPEPVPVPEDIDELRAAFAERREARIEGLRRAGERRLAEGEHKSEAAMNLIRQIPLGQPNIVDTSAGRAFMRQRAKWHEQAERGWALMGEGREYLKRAQAAEDNTAISSDDPDAIEKLLTAAAERDTTQAWMKQVNAAARAGDRAKLAELGLDEAKVERILTPDWAGRVGFASYVLTNNNAQIHRLRERAADLGRQRRAGPKPPEQYGAIEVREEDNRVRIFFPAKPSEQDRSWLKHRGFKWAPSVPAWQRHASPDAWSYARQIAQRLGGPLVREGDTEPAPATNAAGVGELAALVLSTITRVARRSEYGVADLGEIVDEVRTFASKEKAEVHAALTELEDAGLVDLRPWGPHPPNARLQFLAPERPDGVRLLWARPLSGYVGNRNDPIVGYKLALTILVDHPDRRNPTLPKVAVGHRYDWQEFYAEDQQAQAQRRLEELRSGRRTDYDEGSEYAAEVGLFVATRDHRWAGWSVVPWPRERPAEGDAR